MACVRGAHWLHSREGALEDLLGKGIEEGGGGSTGMVQTHPPGGPGVDEEHFHLPGGGVRGERKGREGGEAQRGERGKAPSSQAHTHPTYRFDTCLATFALIQEPSCLTAMICATLGISCAPSPYSSHHAARVAIVLSNAARLSASTVCKKGRERGRREREGEREGGESRASNREETQGCIHNATHAP